MKIHKRLYTYINNENISLEKISILTNIAEKRLVQIFAKDKCEMSLDEYIAVCKALNVPTDYFYDEHEKNEKRSPVMAR
mgnify:CR=1 FL=1